jgi:hypothetical protein
MIHTSKILPYRKAFARRLFAVRPEQYSLFYFLAGGCDSKLPTLLIASEVSIVCSDHSNL